MSEHMPPSERGLAFRLNKTLSPNPMITLHVDLSDATIRRCWLKWDTSALSAPNMARNVQELFFTHQTELLPWPACSSDLSAVEMCGPCFHKDCGSGFTTRFSTINFGNMWKPHGQLYPKDTSKASLILCRGVGLSTV
ncbi:hypothetical protein TNCV_1799671 [Trichonephila clavipes]|nr:hypothetical protein TNCV_1799671 [Trichonephila clavipes]